jgi:hypothetical protein
MSSDQPRRARESSGSPLGSTAAIIIAIIAVVVGFIILRQIRDDDDGGGSSTPEVTSDGTDTDDTSVDGTTEPGDTSQVGVTTTPPFVVTTQAVDTTSTTAFTTEGAIVVVANSSTVNGAAGQLTTALTGAGFDLAAATNATTRLDVSRIYYNTANAQALAVATSVGSLTGITDIAEMPSPPPVEGGTLQAGVDVLVMLGSDKAGKTLEQMSAPEGAVTTTVAGETTTTTTG